MDTLAQSPNRKRLLLTYLGFDGVEFALFKGDEFRPARHVRVDVGSGTSWRRAVRFSDTRSEAMLSTGDDQLDQEILDRASEELVRLEAATAALRAVA